MGTFGVDRAENGPYKVWVTSPYLPSGAEATATHVIASRRKSRITHAAEGERNYHVIFAGRPALTDRDLQMRTFPVLSEACFQLTISTDLIVKLVNIDYIFVKIWPAFR